MTNDAPCQEVVVTGDALRTEGLKRLPVPVSTPGFDAAPYLTATLCVTRDPETGVQQHGHLSRGAEGRRPHWWCAWWRARRPAPADSCTG